ncbi:MAG: phage tail protein, partial [Saccharospirillaceae bacterium]|nr:phage tail protein [Saccharospirillaceae bacterium]
AIASKKPWHGFGHTNVAINGVDNEFEYNVNSNATEGSLLNKNGICYFGKTSSGWSLVGNRVFTGEFGAAVGLAHAVVRKLIPVLEKPLGTRLTPTAMQQEIENVNNWIDSLIAENVVMKGTCCYLHPEKNTVDNYNSGRWFIVFKYSGYSTNEETVVEFVKSNEIVSAFLKEVL